MDLIIYQSVKRDTFTKVFGEMLDAYKKEHPSANGQIICHDKDAPILENLTIILDSEWDIIMNFKAEKLDQMGMIIRLTADLDKRILQIEQSLDKFSFFFDVPSKDLDINSCEVILNRHPTPITDHVISWLNTLCFRILDNEMMPEKSPQMDAESFDEMELEMNLKPSIINTCKLKEDDAYPFLKSSYL